MADYDLVIRNGTVATASDTTQCDVAIKDGVVAALGRGLPAGVREIDAAGRPVLPGPNRHHCHIHQRPSAGGLGTRGFFRPAGAAALLAPTHVLPLPPPHP